jgi:hypothetical protein
MSSVPLMRSLRSASGFKRLSLTWGHTIGLANCYRVLGIRRCTGCSFFSFLTYFFCSVSCYHSGFFFSILFCSNWGKKTKLLMRFKGGNGRDSFFLFFFYLSGRYSLAGLVRLERNTIGGFLAFLLFFFFFLLRLLAWKLS